MEKYRAGVVGIGFIGAAHIEQLRRMGNVEVAALASTTNPDKKAEALCIPRGYANYHDMIDREKLDCLHICTPNSSHYEIAMYALEKGVHVVCEKPMTTTIAEAEKMLAKAKETGLVNAVNYNCRFYPLVFQIREMIRAGKLGSLYHIGGSYLQDWLFLDTDYSWRLENDLSGNSRAFGDIGTHWIDMVQFVTGLKVTEVMADFAVFHKTRKKPLKPVDTYSGMALRPEDYEEKPVSTEDYALVAFHLENGVYGSCTVSQVFAGRKNQMVLDIGGSKSAVHWDSENSNALWIGRRECENGELVKDPSILSPAASGITGFPGGHVEGFPDTFKQSFRKIYEAIAAGGQNPAAGGRTGTANFAGPDFATFEDGLQEMILIEKIIQSARERRWISIK
jgi:predicted dehydrogenase